MGCLLKGGGGLYSRLTVGAVLLAAGAGQRMGERPKALLQLGGVSLIRRQIIALSGAGVDEVVVVLGHHAERIEPEVREFPVTVICNPVPADGQVSSLRLGLSALSHRLDSVLVALADQPLIQAGDITSLIGAYKHRADGTMMVVPEVAGQPGNPILFSAEVRAAILAGDADVGCRRWRVRHPELVMRLQTDNRRFITDVDTPEDIDRFAEQTGHRLHWPADLVVAGNR